MRAGRPSRNTASARARAGFVRRGRDAQRRPCRLQATLIKLVAAWADDYRQFWDASYERLDAYLNHLMTEEPDERLGHLRAPRSRATRPSSPRPAKASFLITRTFDAPCLGVDGASRIRGISPTGTPGRRASRCPSARSIFAQVAAGTISGETRRGREFTATGTYSRRRSAEASRATSSTGEENTSTTTFSERRRTHHRHRLAALRRARRRAPGTQVREDGRCHELRPARHLISSLRHADERHR